MKEVTEEYASQCFQNGVDCSQVVFAHGAAKLGFDEKQAMKIIMDKGLFFSLCNKAAVSACEILDEVL